eukprot:7367292-Alexandrium_andersonii.AAC.1
MCIRDSSKTDRCCATSMYSSASRSDRWAAATADRASSRCMERLALPKPDRTTLSRPVAVTPGDRSRTWLDAQTSSRDGGDR